MTALRVSFAFGAVLVAAVSAVSAAETQLATVGSIDVARYAGLWYEIANYPNRFQKVCVRNTTAEYTVTGRRQRAGRQPLYYRRRRVEC